MVDAQGPMDPRRSSLFRAPAASNFSHGHTSATTDDTLMGPSGQKILPTSVEVDENNSRFFLEESQKRASYAATVEKSRIYEKIEDDNLEVGYLTGDDSEGSESNFEYDSEMEEVTPEVKKKGGRGPTDLKRFWKEFDPTCKINLQFNHRGQPCGLKMSRLTNFFGSLVKEKEISMAAKNWSKVPKLDKEKLWNTVKAFFNIDESYKKWVLRSAGKKWKDFKSYLKVTYYKDELSARENIANGCNGRIPMKQWIWFGWEFSFSAQVVALALANSAQVVALATVQNVDEKSTGLDGNSLSGYIQVLVNVVLKSTTQLPCAHGRVTHLGHAQARCIPWPKENVTETDMTHEYASTISEMDKNLRRYSKVTSIADESPSQLIAEKINSHGALADISESQKVIDKTKRSKIKHDSVSHKAKMTSSGGANADFSQSQSVAEKPKVRKKMKYYEAMACETESQTDAVKLKKKRRIANGAMREATAKSDSHAMEDSHA